MRSELWLANLSHPRRRLLAVAVASLVLFAVVSGVWTTLSFALFDWSGYAKAIERAAQEYGGASGVPIGIGVVSLVEGRLAIFAGGALLAFAAAVGIHRLRRWPLYVVVALLLASLPSVWLSGWIGAVLVLLSAISLIALVCAKFAVPLVGAGFDRDDRTWIAYVLLVGGGLFGAHNFYLKRAWAGFLHILLALLGTLGWGSIVGYVALGALVALCAVDAIAMPRRVTGLIPHIARFRP